MPTLTRKRVNDRPVTWHVHYAGVRVGVIVERSGARRRQISGNGAADFTLAANRAQSPVPVTPGTPLVRLGSEGCPERGHHGKRILRAGRPNTPVGFSASREQR
jgi:hypothetical protein